MSNDTVRQYVKGQPTLIGDTAVNTDFPNPFSYQWTIGIQHEFPGAIALDTAYVGTRGVHVQLVRFWNQVDRVTGIRPVPGYTQFRYRDAGDSTAYHSWQTSLRKRFSAGLSLGVNYTYASAYSYTGAADFFCRPPFRTSITFAPTRGRRMISFAITSQPTSFMSCRLEIRLSKFGAYT